jgi:Sulfatase
MKARDIPGVVNPAGEREILPKPQPPFKGQIGRTVKDSTPDFPKGIEAPKGAPNVLLILTDDVGFGASSRFGGPIDTPNFQRLADNGLRYNKSSVAFHHNSYFPLFGMSASASQTARAGFPHAAFTKIVSA